MDKICKYYKYQKYVSYDNGTTWQPLDEYQRGELIQFNSEDCGGGIGALYKWEVISGDYECVGYDKYEKTQKYVSYDNGVTYSAVTPSEYGIGGLIQRNSEDCGYMPSPTGETKWIAKYQSGFTESETTTSPIRIKSAPCSATPVHYIGDHEIPSCLDCGGIGASGRNYFIREVKIGDCVDLKIADGAFMGDWYESLTSVTLSNTVKLIGFNAFQGCKRLNNITIPNSVTRIDGNAFNGCDSFTNIVIPDSVTTVGPYEEQGEPTTEGIFAYCDGLTSCTLSRSMTNISPSMFRGCKSLTSVGGSGSGASVEIPSNITKISKEAFFQCDGITSVAIPNTVSELGDSVFNSCDNLRNVSLPNSITDIPDSTFNACSSLTNIIIPNSVTRISSSAFYNCNLSSINIPSGVTFIGDEAFARNSGMTSVTVNAITPPTLGSKAFDYTNNCPIYVPCESVEAYKAASDWRSYASRIYGISPCYEPIYRTTSSSTYCTGYDKYVDVYSQVSYDNGSTWQTTATTSTLVEPNSPDCGYTPPTTYTKLNYSLSGSGKQMTAFEIKEVIHNKTKASGTGIKSGSISLPSNAEIDWFNPTSYTFDGSDNISTTSGVQEWRFNFLRVTTSEGSNLVEYVYRIELAKLAGDPTTYVNFYLS